MDGGPQRTLLLTVRYAAAGIGRQALNVLLIPLYTVYLDPTDFGVLALLTISGTLVLRTVETPVGNALQRFYFRPDYSDRRELLLFNLMLYAGANVLAILFLYRWAGNVLAGFLFHDPALAATVRLHGFVVAFSITTSLTGTFVMLLERSRIYTIASILNVVVTGVVSVSLLYFARLGVAAVVLGQAAGLLFQTLLCLPLLVQHAERVLNRDVLGEPLRFGYATLVSGYSNILIIAGDRYLLGFLRTVNEVGLYSFGCNIGNMVTLAIGTPVISGVWPTIRRMETRVEEQRAFVRQVTTFVCVAGAALAVGLSIFAHELIRLLASRPEFVAAAIVVPLLAFSQALQGLAAFTEAGITLGNKPAYCSVTAFAAAAVNLGLGFLLIPRFGILGAGCGALSSFVVWNGLNLYFSTKFYRLQFDVRRLLHSLLLGALLVAVASFLPTSLSPLILWPLKGLLAIAYPVLLVATGFLTPSERRVLIGLMRRTQRVRRRSSASRVTVDEPMAVPALTSLD
ncbi:MAG TPA: oligosaccharide flippase family protein [Planctomycetaceae bacterium]|nr:oligosaccharide flippase family protein [Planctomycetaceae bacterium]